jgi:threonyl-tRNA synthetase
MLDGYFVSLSVRGEDRSKYLGTDEVWAAAEGALEKAAKDNDLNYKRVEGEATFYGPKLDFMFKDAIGRQWQLATIQCDFNLPERFDLSFVNENGEKERPVVIHRAISGSLERFMGIMIEHYAGAFPTWLAPIQVRLAPVSEKHVDGAFTLKKELADAGIRVDVDDADESVSKKIRNAAGQKIPYVVVVGDKELAGEEWMVRVRGQEEQEKMSKNEFIERVKKEIRDRR